MLLRFGDFMPDASTFEANGSPYVNNVLPGPNFYAPMPSLADYSADGLTAECLGALSIRELDGDMRIFAGDINKLYELASADLTWSDVSKAGSPAYAVAAGFYWWMIQWKNKILAGASAVAPQSFDLASSSVFADIAGSPPTSKAAGVIGPHVMLGNLAATPNGVQWCAASDETTWTTGGGPGKGGTEEFVTGGHVRDVSPGRLTGYVWQESVIRRAYFVGGNQQFQFDVVIDDIGLEAPRSRVTVGGIHFFLSQHGFQSFNGETVNPIGRGRIDKYFETNVGSGDKFATWGAADQADSKIYWVYSDGTNRFYLCYDYRWDKWSHGSINASVLFTLSTLGVDLDTLDAKFPTYNMDTFPFSLDSRALQGGSPTFGAFDATSFKLATFSGTNLEATIDTMEGQVTPGRRSVITGVRPQVEGADDATVTMGVRERLGDAITIKTAVSQQASGICPTRATGRYHKARVIVPAGSTWTKADGVDVPQDRIRPLGDR